MARRSARGSGRADGIALAVALVVSGVALALSEPTSDRVAGALRGSILAPLASMQRGAERAHRAISERDSASYAADTATIRGILATRLAQENDRLRGMLGLSARLRSGFIAAEAMHGQALGEEHTIVLNAGSAAGIVPFSAVIAARGIVGYVRSVDEQSSVAIVWPHPDFRVSGVSLDGEASGIVAAHLGDGPARFLLEMRGVPFRSPLDSGAVIVSSGVGGTFPAGIPVGTVLRQLEGSEGWERNYLLLPAARSADVGSVLVLLPSDAPADMRTMWSHPESATEARQRAVAAGDSLARMRLRDSLARVAVQDSIERAALRDSILRALLRDSTVRARLRDSAPPPIARPPAAPPPARGDTLGHWQ